MKPARGTTPFRFQIPNLPHSTYAKLRALCRAHEASHWLMVVAALELVHDLHESGAFEVSEAIEETKRQYPHATRAAEQWLRLKATREAAAQERAAAGTVPPSTSPPSGGAEPGPERAG